MLGEYTQFFFFFFHKEKKEVNYIKMLNKKYISLPQIWTYGEKNVTLMVINFDLWMPELNHDSQAWKYKIWETTQWGHCFGLSSVLPSGWGSPFCIMGWSFDGPPPTAAMSVWSNLSIRVSSFLIVFSHSISFFSDVPIKIDFHFHKLKKEIDRFIWFNLFLWSRANEE